MPQPTTQRKLITAAEFKSMIGEGGNGTPDAGIAVVKFFPTKVIDLGEETLRLRFVISTIDVDRDRDTIDPKGWNLKDYKKNPVMLWAHQHSGLPIAKGLEIGLDNGALAGDWEFTPYDLYPFGYTVYRMYKGGFMSAQSVGFDPKRWEIVQTSDRPYGYDFKEQDLLETSAVPVPSNPNALVVARSAGIDTAPFIGWAEEMLDLAPPAGFKNLRGMVDKGGLLFATDFLEALRKAADPINRVQVAMPGSKAHEGFVIEIKDADPAPAEEAAVIELADAPAESPEAEALEITTNDDAPAADPPADEPPADSTPDPLPGDDADAKQGASAEGDEPPADPAPAAEDAPAPDAEPKAEAPGGDDDEAMTFDMTCAGPVPFEKAHPKERREYMPVAAKDAPLAYNKSLNQSPEIAVLLSAYCPGHDKAMQPISIALTHHNADAKGTVVWAGVVDSMKALAGGVPGVTVPEQDRKAVYDHLAKHYREDFDTDPPAFDLIAAQILRTFPAEFAMDGDTGAIKHVTPEQAAAVRVEAAKAAALSALSHLNDSESEAAGFDLKSARDLLAQGASAKSATQREGGGEGIVIEIADNPKGIDVDEATITARVERTVAPAVKEAVGAAIRKRFGRVD